MPEERSSYVADYGSSAPKSVYIRDESPVKESSSNSESVNGQSPKSDYVPARDESPVKDNASDLPDAKSSSKGSAAVSSEYAQTREEHQVKRSLSRTKSSCGGNAGVSTGCVQTHEERTAKGPVDFSPRPAFARGAANPRTGPFAYAGNTFDKAVIAGQDVLAAILGSIILTKDAAVSAVCMYIGIHFWLLTAVLEKIQAAVKFCIHKSATSYEMLKKKSADSYEKAKGVGVSSFGLFKEKSDVGYHQAKHAGQSGVQLIKETTSDGLDLLKDTAVRVRKTMSELAAENKLKSDKLSSNAEKVL